MFAASKTDSVSSEIPDPQFANVTMLLHGDGTNGAQNNTFLDSSTNNFAITRNGNTTQGSFSPYGPNWSTFFDGSQDNLYTPSTSALNVGSGNFTFECFFNVSVFNGGNIIRGSNQYSACALLLVGTTVVYYISSTGSSWDIAEGKTAGTGLSAGVWYHLALVRNGNVVTPYLNGVAGTTTTTSATFSALNGLNIGAEQNGIAGGSFNGYISNVRIVVGTAVYTSGFTPPIANLTAISGTQLLACQNNRFIDNSSNNFSFTTVGTPSVQRFNPFGTTTAYSTSVIGGSGYFDDSNDYLTAPANAGFDYGTGDYTIEGWVYSATTTWSLYATGGGGSADQFCCAGGNLFWGFGINLFGAGTGLPNFFTDQNINQWVHIAVSKSSGTTRAFKNGVVIATSTVNTAIGSSTNVPFIAVRTEGSYPLNGYMSNLRIVKGTGIYTSAFTPPTAPLSAITNTTLLLNYINGAIFDNAMMNDLETVGNAQISTSVVKYGTGSMYFDGTGDNLFTRTTPDLALGTGDFTVEFWINLAANLVSFAKIIQMGTTGDAFTIETQSTTNVLTVTNFTSSVYLVSNTALTNNTWIHVAVTRASGTLRLFQNGIQVGSAANTVNFTNTGTGVYIGQSSLGTAMNGYIDDLRITKGYARYTANFTPPTAAFSNTGPY